MADTLTDFIESLGPVKPFKAGPIFQPGADLLTVFFENREHYAERVDQFLTVYKSFKGDTLVGFELKGIRHKVQELTRLLHPKAGEAIKVKVGLECKPHINLLLTFYMKEPLGSTRPAYKSVYDRAHKISDLLVPDELILR
jgi:hypothetical protein